MREKVREGKRDTTTYLIKMHVKCMLRLLQLQLPFKLSKF